MNYPKARLNINGEGVEGNNGIGAPKLPNYTDGKRF